MRKAAKKAKKTKKVKPTKKVKTVKKAKRVVILERTRRERLYGSVLVVWINLCLKEY